ncbi:MAG: hypothetical protein HQL27_01860 [Candidatus Omnitrophica bacterium]|nr:hypothetical protein [Candidatus Omnitrophota bacterium]
MLSIKNKTVTIIGAQKSGIALCSLIQSQGGVPKISEQKDKDKLPSNVFEWLDGKMGIEAQFGAHTEEFIAKSDLVVLSPGVPYNSLTVDWAKGKNITVLGEIEFAFQFCKKPVIAITGSNGKTTTSTLTHNLLEKAGYKSCLCGNIGAPFSEQIDKINKSDYAVIEVSSFQMESLLGEDKKANFAPFKPHIAAILNFNQNHLDRHKDMDEYFQAKARIFENQDENDYAILNYANSRLMELSLSLKAKTIFFNDGEDNQLSENQNHLAVFAIARALKIDAKICREVFAEFKGVEHRLEWVRNINGVDYVNDSKCTTAEAGEWAMKTIKNPIVMICGGYDKHVDFSHLKPLAAKKVKEMIVIGATKDQLKNTFIDTIKVREGASFEEAVNMAKDIASRGDCVLLSPMCASWDMFNNFEERGKLFKQIVGGFK